MTISSLDGATLGVQRLQSRRPFSTTRSCAQRPSEPQSIRRQGTPATRVSSDRRGARFSAHASLRGPVDEEGGLSMLPARRRRAHLRQRFLVLDCDDQLQDDACGGHLYEVRAVPTDPTLDDRYSPGATPTSSRDVRTFTRVPNRRRTGSPERATRIGDRCVRGNHQRWRSAVLSRGAASINTTERQATRTKSVDLGPEIREPLTRWREFAPEVKRFSTL